MLLLALGAGAQTSPALRITQFESLPGHLVRLSFEDAGTNGILNFVPAHFFSLNADATNYLYATARIVNLGSGRYQTVIADPSQPMTFFRIAGFLPPDTDGDGLSDALEDLIGSDPNRADTDGDGFGDGVEVANGTDACDVLDQPPLAVLPAVSFAQSLSATDEGAGTCDLLITVSAPFTGEIRYEIGAGSTAVAGSDFEPVSGALWVNGTSGTIPIRLLDDWTIKEPRRLYVDLLPDSAGRYRRAGLTRHILRIEDNDGYWTGTLKEVGSHTNQFGARTNTVGFTELSFRLKLLRQGNAAQASLIRTNPPGSHPEGVGFVPAGEWPMQSFTLGTNSLVALSGEIPVPPTHLFPGAQMNRVLQLTAQPANELFYDFRSLRILGEYTERLVPGNARFQHLAREGRRGIFVLVREMAPEPPAP